jgi:3-dehydroquinate dehydratase
MDERAPTEGRTEPYKPKKGLHSVTAEAARGIVAGFGIRSYLMGLDAVADLVSEEQSAAAKA